MDESTAIQTQTENGAATEILPNVSDDENTDVDMTAENSGENSGGNSGGNSTENSTGDLNGNFTENPTGNSAEDLTEDPSAVMYTEVPAEESTEESAENSAEGSAEDSAEGSAPSSAMETSADSAPIISPEPSVRTPAVPAPPSVPTDVSAEVERLRRELAEARSAAERIVAGFEELTDLFPGADLSSMPDEFRQAVRRGVPPAAAYALELRRREVESARAAEAQRLARETSAGGLNASAPTLLSPDEVRAMSREEVRQNFSRIVESMKSW